ncbi:hypothetical protein LAD12857_00790 [Lacrimispora amygdalina]|uniref:HTH cro/C1-type domain-containing protein n=1 Tax=Lacrimispora amygdalina TaxID=253257 RepID=A0ABQ5M109_9FIRM
MGIGVKIKELLSEKKMSVAELSRLTGISTNTLYAVIRRDSDRMNGEALIKISEIFQVPLSTLFSDGETMLVLDDKGEFHNVDYSAIGLGLENQKEKDYRQFQDLAFKIRKELTPQQKQDIIKILLSDD